VCGWEGSCLIYSLGSNDQWELDNATMMPMMMVMMMVVVLVQGRRAWEAGLVEPAREGEAPSVLIPQVAEGLVQALRTFVSHAEVQSRGCFLLAALTEGSSGNRARLGAAAAGEVVVVAMQAFPSDRGVQQYGCFALACLAASHGENAKRLLSAGACECVAGALKAFSLEPEVWGGRLVVTLRSHCYY
jgi:hypothetical protein